MAGAATGTYARRVGRVLRERASSIVVFVVIFVLFEFVRAWTIELDPLTAAYVLPLWPMIGVAILAPALIEATALRGVALMAAIVVATVAAVGMVAAAVYVLHPSPVATGVSAGMVLSNEAFLYRGWWLYSAAGLLFIAYCRTREREQNVLRAARQAELARADAQRDIVASRLKVLQARVEPSLLFDALADVRAMYLASPDGADALLDDLVAYLRAALPQMRGGASTVGREIALAEAYLRIVPAGRNKQLATQSRVAEEVAEADFPPMVLLPLVHGAAEAGCAQVSIVGSTENGGGAIAVRATCAEIPGAWAGDALHVVRETLLHYLGSDASLIVARDASGALATVTWRYGEPSAVVPERVA